LVDLQAFAGVCRLVERVRGALRGVFWSLLRMAISPLDLIW